MVVSVDIFGLSIGECALFVGALLLAVSEGVNAKCKRFERERDAVSFMTIIFRKYFYIFHLVTFENCSQRKIFYESMKMKSFVRKLIYASLPDFTSQ